MQPNLLILQHSSTLSKYHNLSQSVTVACWLASCQQVLKSSTGWKDACWERKDSPTSPRLCSTTLTLRAPKCANLNSKQLRQHLDFYLFSVSGAAWRADQWVDLFFSLILSTFNKMNLKRLQNVFIVEKWPGLELSFKALMLLRDFKTTVDDKLITALNIQPFLSTVCPSN